MACSHDAIMLPECCYSLHCALGLIPGRPVVIEPFSASLRRIRALEHTLHQKPQRSDNVAEAIRTCRQSWSRVPVCPFTFVCLCLDGLHDLILALELLLVLKAVRVLSFSGTQYHGTTDICLCLMTRGQRRSAQIQHLDSANIVHELSTAQTGFTARP